MNILTFIQELNYTDGYIHHIYSKGGCYSFHILLSKMFKGCTTYISGTNDHIITRHKGKFYDVYGELDNQDGYRKLREEEIPIVSKWSFHRYNLLKLQECPHCDEPLVFHS